MIQTNKIGNLLPDYFKSLSGPVEQTHEQVMEHIKQISHFLIDVENEDKILIYTQSSPTAFSRKLLTCLCFAYIKARKEAADRKVIKGLYILNGEDIILTLSYKCQPVYSLRDLCVTIFIVDRVRQIANNFSLVKCWCCIPTKRGLGKQDT